METLLDWINLDEFMTLVVLICLLVFTGQQMARPDSLVYRQARRLAGGTIVLYALMAINAWGLSGAYDLLLITIRSLLAAGVIFGLSSIILAVVHHVVGDPVAGFASRFRRLSAERQRRLTAEETRRNAAAKERLSREQQAARAIAAKEDNQRQDEEFRHAEQERAARVAAARTELVNFYDGHAELLQESLPPSLFKSQMETRLPESITGEAAWQAVQTIIAEMLPLIAAARDKSRAEADQKYAQRQQVLHVRRQIKRLEKQIQKIESSSTFEADVSLPEIAALQEQIREFEEELEFLQEQPPESES